MTAKISIFLRYIYLPGKIKIEYYYKPFLSIMTLQVLKMHAFGLYLVFIVPSVLAIMNLAWFGKILKGLKKTISKQRQ